MTLGGVSSTETPARESRFPPVGGAIGEKKVIGSGGLGFGASESLRGFLVEPQRLDVGRAQGVTAACKDPSNAGRRVRIRRCRSDGLA